MAIYLLRIAPPADAPDRFERVRFYVEARTPERACAALVAEPDLAGRTAEVLQELAPGDAVAVRYDATWVRGIARL